MHFSPMSNTEVLRFLDNLTPRGRSLWRARIEHDSKASITFYSPFAPIEHLAALSPNGRPLIASVLNEGCLGRVGVCVYSCGLTACWIEEYGRIRAFSLSSVTFHTLAVPLVQTVLSTVAAIFDTLNDAWNRTSERASLAVRQETLIRSMVPLALAARIYDDGSGAHSRGRQLVA